jgi:hypothetical protein
MTGDLTNKTKIWNFMEYDSGCAFTGSIANLTNLSWFVVASAGDTVVKPTTLINHTQLVYFSSGLWVLSSADVNQYLADFWANKDSAKAFPTQRSIMLAGAGCGAPTGQGIIDKANLKAYHSPTPPGTAALWTILTN